MSRREQLEQLLQDDPDDVFLSYAYALELVKEGQVDTGLARLRDILQQNPDYVPAYFRQGQILAEQGRVDEARGVLETGIGVARRTGDQHALGEMTEFLNLLEAPGS